MSPQFQLLWEEAGKAQEFSDPADVPLTWRSWGYTLFCLAQQRHSGWIPRDDLHRRIQEAIPHIGALFGVSGNLEVEAQRHFSDPVNLMLDVLSGLWAANMIHGLDSMRDGEVGPFLQALVAARPGEISMTTNFNISGRSWQF